jgi:branched-chain amino acid transport system substrate-binding protein
LHADLVYTDGRQSGQAAVLGMQAALEDINAAGGVLGKKLTLVVRDDTSQSPKSIQNMSDPIDNERLWLCSARRTLATRWPASTSPTRRRSP